MGLRDRWRRRRRGAGGPRGAADVEKPGSAVTPPPWQGEPRGPARTAVDILEVVDLPALIRGCEGTLLVHHWASWDEASLASLPSLKSLVHPGLRILGLGWDAFLEAPTGRIPGMAQRPARWADGSELAAYRDGIGLSWPTRMLRGSPEQLRELLELPDLGLPAVHLHAAGGARLAAHLGPTSGEGWAAFCATLAATLDVSDDAKPR